ncbi:MAG: TetR/AcrR family transcriptional regulator [Microbacterium sp.]
MGEKESASEVNRRRGRPRVSSRNAVVEAACELYLERGFPQTSISDIAQRVGISRSSFFNYAGTKSDLLWAGFDERLQLLDEALLSSSVPDAMLAFADRYAPDEISLVYANAEAMDISDELEQTASVRAARIARAAGAALRRGGADALTASVLGGAYASALMVSLSTWALAGAGSRSFSAILADALEVLGP